MTKLVKIFFMLITVSMIHLTFGNGMDSVELLRVKKYYPPWLWRNNNFDRFREEVILDRQLSREDSPNFESEDSPNNYRLNLGRANTAAPNPRISESKCDEYLKAIKDRVEYEQTVGKFRYTIGGRLTKPGEFPHMGALGWRAIKGTWIFICGSSLISSKYMLTAAHCSKVTSRYPNIANTRPEIVRLGDKNIIDVLANGQNPIDTKIQRFIVHPQYDALKKYYDIAIIELEKDVYIDKNVQPACLWTKFDTSSLGSKATVTGWGVIETGSLQISPELQAADIEILDSYVCDDLLKPSCNRLWCGMAENQICAGNLSGGVDTCQGDSGGPLQVKINLPSDSEGSMHYIIGVTSFGFGCARANTPSVYTRVSSFIDWIEAAVWSDVL